MVLSGFFVAAVQLLLVAGPAHAAINCSYSGASHSVTVGMTANGDATTIVRNGSAINVNGAACGAATVNNTDTNSASDQIWLYRTCFWRMDLTGQLSNLPLLLRGLLDRATLDDGLPVLRGAAQLARRDTRM